MGIQNRPYREFDEETLAGFDRLFGTVDTPQQKEILYVSDELVRGTHKKSDGTADFLLEDTGMQNENLAIDGMNDYLCFFTQNAEKKMYAAGWGSEKGELARLGAEILFGKKFSELLEDIRLGESKDDYRRALELLRSNPEQDLAVPPDVIDLMIKNREGGSNVH